MNRRPFLSDDECNDEDFNAVLDAMLDRELTDAERVAFLAESSPDPKKRREILETSRAVSLLRDPVRAPDLSGAIMARVEHHRPLLSSRLAWFVRPSRIAGIAAGAAIALTLVGMRGAIVRAESEAPLASLAVATADDLFSAPGCVSSGVDELGDRLMNAVLPPSCPSSGLATGRMVGLDEQVRGSARRDRSSGVGSASIAVVHEFVMIDAEVDRAAIGGGLGTLPVARAVTSTRATGVQPGWFTSLAATKQTEGWVIADRHRASAASAASVAAVPANSNREYGTSKIVWWVSQSDRSVLPIAGTAGTASDWFNASDRPALPPERFVPGMPGLDGIY